MALAEKVAKARAPLETQLENAPRGSHESMGGVERGIQEIAGRAEVEGYDVLAVQEVTFHSQLVRAPQTRRLVALFVLAADSRKVLAAMYRSAVVLVVAHCC